MASLSALSQALAARRGRGLDSSLFHAGHLDEHTPVEHEAHAVPPPASIHNAEHTDEHKHVEGEPPELAEPHSQSHGMGEGELHAEIMEHVSGHASKEEHEQLKGHSPRSLGERAKMEALNKKFSK